MKKITALLATAAMLTLSLTTFSVSAAEADAKMSPAAIDADAVVPYTKGTFTFDVTEKTNFGKFEATGSTVFVSFNNCTTGSAVLQFHSGSYTGRVVGEYIIPKNYVSTQTVSFASTAKTMYYITIEPYSDYIQAAGSFSLDY